MKKRLLRFSHKIYRVISSPISVVFVLLVVGVWFVVGAFFNFNDTWYRWYDIFAFTTTLVMVFVIESIEYTDTEAIHKKLDEIIKKLPQTNNAVAEIEKKIRGEIEE